jgi:dynactin 5
MGVLQVRTLTAALMKFLSKPDITHVLGQFLEDLPESTQELVEAQTKAYYNRFQPIEASTPSS